LAAALEGMRIEDIFIKKYKYKETSVYI